MASAVIPGLTKWMVDLNYAISRQLSALSQELNLLVLADG
jgi:hypothetical protein